MTRLVLIWLYVFVLDHRPAVSSPDGAEFIEIPSEIISSKLNDIIFFDTYLPENTFNISLMRPNGETIHFTHYFDNNLQRENIHDVRLYTHKTSYDEYSVNDIWKDKLRTDNDVEMIDTCYNDYTKSYKHKRCKIYDETTCEDDFVSRKFRIGPLRQEHHGNWLLSVCFYENKKKIVEAFQVITLEIKENINTIPEMSILRTGDTFKLTLGLNIPYLESCELIAPRTTQDRYYERDMNNLNNCGYVIPNVTSEDRGAWKIMAVGRIVYEGYGYLYVTENITSEHI